MKVIGQNRHELTGFPPATVEVDVPEGIAKVYGHSPVVTFTQSMGGKDANVIQHIDSLIARDVMK